MTLSPGARPEFLRSFGRIKSRTLSPYKQSLLEGNFSGMGICPDAPGAAEIAPSRFFSAPMQAYELEIGFGSGEHLAARAAARPHTGFIGAEPYLNGVASCIAKLRANGSDNVRIWNDDARLLLAAWQKKSLRRIFILYPDPWPKARHHKKRLITPELLALLAPLLEKDGRICIITDHADYAEHIGKAIEACPLVAIVPPLEEDTPPATKYRQKADAASRPVFRFDLAWA